MNVNECVLLIGFKFPDYTFLKTLKVLLLDVVNELFTFGCLTPCFWPGEGAL